MIKGTFWNVVSRCLQSGGGYGREHRMVESTDSMRGSSAQALYSVLVVWVSAGEV